MSPRLRTHLITAALFAGVVLVLAVLWWLRNVFVYVLLVGVGLVAYYGLYLVVASRLKARDERPEPEPPPDDGLD
ncbi:MAG TPA: hypothetical protein VGQ83_37895 [Polyangia bacterium]|jgi:Ca2+/Na+ antiporter